MLEVELKNIFRYSPLPIYVLQDGFFKLVNPKMVELTGYSKEELLAMPFYELIHPGDRGWVMDNAMRRLAGERVEDRYEFKSIARNGVTISVRGFFSLIQFGGRPAILGQALDITEQKRLEESLRESEARYRAILDGIQEGYFEVTLSGSYVFVNPAMTRILGYDPEELQGMNYREYTVPEHHDSVYQAFNKVYRTGQPTDFFDWEVIRKDGARRHVVTSISLRRDGSGKPVGFSGIIRDITGRKRAEDALQKERDFNRAVLETVGALVLVLDASGRIILFNRACKRVTGYRFREVKNKRLWDVFIPHEEVERVKRVFRELKAKHYPAHTENHWLCKNGERRLVAWSNTVLTDQSGEVEYIISTGIDITEQRRAETALREVVQGVSASVGMEFFHSMILHLGRALDADHALVGELVQNGGDRIRTIVAYSEGKFIDNFEYPLEGTPCAGAVDKTVCFYPEKVGELFPDCKLLKKIGAESYLGVPLFDSKQNKLGLIVVLHNRPASVEQFRFAKSLIIIFAARVSAELERLRTDKQLKYLSLHDSLTGLYNRACFEQEIQRFEKDPPRSMGIIVCDVDGLKLVNDTLGHEAGDRLLVATAGIIKKAFREGDTVARIGGDEFAVLLPDSDERAVEKACRRIMDAVEEYNAVNTKLPVNISAGYAHGEGPSVNVRDLFKEADNNMYRKKLYRSSSARSAIVQTLMKAMEARDFITEGHADRLQHLAVRLGKAIGLPERRLTELRLLAQFHDIGKVGIPDRILFKPGPLTAEEAAEMRKHCEIGHRIALSANDLVCVADLILKHHEWWNGKGYPLGISGEAIPLECRILAIADAYDAMTSDRPYRKAMTRYQAVRELVKCAGTQFDPYLVKKFIQIIDN